MNRKLTKIILHVLLLAMLLSLAACGGGGDSDSDDPNVGTWKAVSATMMGITMEVADMFEGGVTLELKANGKFTLDVDGEKGNGKWEYDGDALKFSASDADMTGSINNGILTLTNLLGMGVDITFEKEGGYSGSGSRSSLGTGDAKSGDRYYKLSWASEEGEKISGDDMRAMGLDYFVVLYEDGSAAVQLDHGILGVWKDGVITVEGEELPFTVTGDELTIEMEGTVIAFALSNETPPDKNSFSSSEPSGGEDDGDAALPGSELSEALAWWDGDWYGYWEISGTTDFYEELDDSWWDCYAVIDMGSDGEGTLYLWDDYEVLATAKLQVSEGGGSGFMGAATSEGGAFGDCALSHADWIIDPSLYGYDDYMVIDGYYEDSEYLGEGFYYYVYLRPWGVLWNDFSEYQRPPYHDYWYLEVCDLPMLEAISNLDDAFIHPEVGSAGTGGDSVGGGSTTGGSAGVSGPWEEYTKEDKFFISYPSDAFFFDDEWIFDTISAKDGSVRIDWLLQISTEDYDANMKYYDSYSEYDQYSTETLTVAGYKARRITYYDSWYGYVSQVYVDFGHGGTTGYFGVSFSCTSETDMASTWTPEVQAILNSIRVVQ